MSTAPARGKIRLYDQVTTDLPAGNYRVMSGLQVSVGRTPLPPPAEQAMYFQIDAPRFVLDAGEVAGRHPEIPSQGAYGDRLPHVVLGRRTLPWERQGPDGIPWLALLVVTKAEAMLATGTLRTVLPGGVITALDKIETITGDPTITVLRFIQSDVMRAVLPSKTDVSLLCHVRQANLADTALAGKDDDGWFAVVAANRLPLSVQPEGKEYLACLVSLEGRADVWSVRSGEAPPPLVVLHSWTFTSSGIGGTFEYLANHLDVAAYGSNADRQRLLDANGTLALDREDRQGNVSTVRYRSPLRGISAAPLSSSGTDISRRAARELGRLLGSADARFLRELVSWHRDAEANARAQLVTGVVSAMLGGTRSGARRPAATTSAKLDVHATLATRLARCQVPRANLGQVPSSVKKVLRTANKGKGKKR